MKKDLRKELNEPTFGEKLQPILKEMSDIIIEHATCCEGDKPCYGDEAMFYAAEIFFDVFIDKLYDRQERDKMTLNERKTEAEEVGSEIYNIIKKHTGIDLYIDNPYIKPSDGKVFS